jgi:hypothetical protein
LVRALAPVAGAAYRETMRPHVWIVLSLWIVPLWAEELPVRGLHLMGPDPDQVPLLIDFITRDLPAEGVNTLILEVGYGFQWKSHPELVQGTGLSREQAADIANAGREAGIRVIPMLNCLGHQSWAANTFPLLTRYPQFDETPGLYPGNEGIYCRSYCPLHPEVHGVVNALIDELLQAFAANAFHVGMDEVFLLGEEACPRCRGRNPAELFAGEVSRLHEHLKARGAQMWMWGDRFLDGVVTGIGKWEASENGTAPAVDLVPKDIVIADWHYEFSPPTAGYFAVKGFPVVMSPWRKPEVALQHLEQIWRIRASSNPAIAERALGVLHTTWCNPGQFIRAYRGETAGVSDSARESAACFRKLFQAIRSSGSPAR